MKKSLSCFLVILVLLLAFCLPAFGQNFSVEVGASNTDYTQGWGTINPTLYSVSGDYKVNDQINIIGSYSWNNKMHGFDANGLDCGDYALVLFDLGGQYKLVTGSLGQISGLLGYGSFTEFYSNPGEDGDESAYAGLYLGLAGEINLKPLILGASYKYYLAPTSCGSGYSYSEQDNTKISIYDIYVEYPITEKLGLKGGYSYNDMSSDIPGGYLIYELKNRYVAVSFSF